MSDISSYLYWLKTISAIENREQDSFDSFVPVRKTVTALKEGMLLKFEF